MLLSELLSAIEPIEVFGRTDKEINGLHFDSRKIGQNDLFVAQVGTAVDGHTFIDGCVSRGAAAIVLSDRNYLPSPLRGEQCTYILVENTDKALGLLASKWFGEPSKALTLVGVTGTNGKTTIATLLFKMFRRFGYKCGLCSTVCNYIDDEAFPTDHTTPDPITLNRLLGRMANEGCRYAFMEVSSHSVAQHRIAGLTFRGGIFTNLTRDHLDYHKTVEAYRDAKKGFFDMLPKGAFAVTNADDKNGLFMTQNTQATVKTYSLRSMADFRARILEEGFDGMQLEIDGREVCVQFIGRFNVSNLLAVYGAAVCMGKQPTDVLVA